MDAHLQAQAARLTRQLEHGTLRGDSVGLVDYEKLKIEVDELNQTIRARDKELPVLRKEATHASQVCNQALLQLQHRQCISVSCPRAMGSLAGVAGMAPQTCLHCSLPGLWADPFSWLWLTLHAQWHQ